MLIEDFLERESWISKENLNPAELSLLKQYALVYVMGKGDGLVPVLIPNDCVEAMKTLIDLELRKKIGVKDDNGFVFCIHPRILRLSHWRNEIYDVCKKIHIPVINATLMRHRTSTFFWKLEGIDPSTVDTFMDHMGHSENIDTNIYAVTPALNTLKKIAPIIDRLDQVTSNNYIETTVYRFQSYAQFMV